jgi:hypothetical protein
MCEIAKVYVDSYVSAATKTLLGSFGPFAPSLIQNPRGPKLRRRVLLKRLHNLFALCAANVLRALKQKAPFFLQ